MALSQFTRVLDTSDGVHSWKNKGLCQGVSLRAEKDHPEDRLLNALAFKEHLPRKNAFSGQCPTVPPAHSAHANLAGGFQVGACGTPRSEEVTAAHGGAKDRCGKTSPAALRRGRWTEEEEAYAWCLIRHFERGVLRIPSGTSLRNFLAEKLHCDPMRISKKFAGDSSVGKRVYHRCPRGVAEPGGDLARAEAELEAHEQVFFGKAKRSKTTRNKSSRQAQNFTASVFEAPCSSSSYSETSSASTKRGGAMLALELATSWPCTKRADTCHSGLGGKRQRTTSDCVRSEPFARAYGCGSDEGAQKESHGGIERGVPPFVPAWRHQQHEQPQQKRDWAWRSGDGDYSSYREAETQRLGFDRCHDDVVAGLFLNFVRGAAEAALSMKARSVLGDTTETPADHGPSDGHISPTSSFDYSSSSSDSGISTTGSDCF